MHLKASGELRVATTPYVTHILSFPDRQFVVSTYPTLKQHNPDLPILIREAQGTPARAFARFGSSSTLFMPWAIYFDKLVAERGVERNVVLDGLSSKDVAARISELLG